MKTEKKEIKLYDLNDQKLIKEKTTPKDRWYNTSLAFMVGSIAVLFGVALICIIIIIFI